jgi:hypothetical protein
MAALAQWKEQHVSRAKEILSTIQQNIQYRPEDWQNYVQHAKEVVSSVDQSQIIYDPRRLAEQLWLVVGLQDYAYTNHDTGGIVEITAWCERQLLTIYSYNPHNVDALKGTSSSLPCSFHNLVARLETQIEEDFPEKIPEKLERVGISSLNASRGRVVRPLRWRFRHLQISLHTC